MKAMTTTTKAAEKKAAEKKAAAEKAAEKKAAEEKAAAEKAAAEKAAAQDVSEGKTALQIIKSDAPMLQNLIATHPQSVILHYNTSGATKVTYNYIILTSASDAINVTAENSEFTALRILAKFIIAFAEYKDNYLPFASEILTIAKGERNITLQPSCNNELKRFLSRAKAIYFNGTKIEADGGEELSKVLHFAKANFITAWSIAKNKGKKVVRSFFHNVAVNGCKDLHKQTVITTTVASYTHYAK